MLTYNITVRTVNIISQLQHLVIHLISYVGNVFGIDSMYMLSFSFYAHASDAGKHTNSRRLLYHIYIYIYIYICVCVCVFVFVTFHVSDCNTALFNLPKLK
jgi:hypothetical protein